MCRATAEGGNATNDVAVEWVGDGEGEAVVEGDGVAVGRAPVEVEADEAGDVVGAGLGGDGGGVAFLDDVAVFDDDEPVGQDEGVERVVGDEQGRAGVVGEVAVQFGAGVQAGAGVEGGEWFVEQQQQRVDGQGAGQRDPLGLPAGQLAGFAAGVVGQADPVEPVGGRSGGRRAGRRRGGGGRRRRCPARSGAGRAGSPGTPRRWGGVRAVSTCPTVRVVEVAGRRG